MDIKRLLKSLLDRKVKFLVIGAWALPAHGHERMTRDIDILIEPTRANVRRTIAALLDVGYDSVMDAPLEIFLTKKVLLRQYVLQTGIHPFVKGVSFRDAWKRRKKTNIKGLEVFVPSLEDLISMKRAAGRKRDKLDLEVLKAIQQRISKKA